MKTIQYLLTVLLMATSMAAAKPVDPSLIPSDARWAVYVDVDALKATTLRNAVWAAIEAEGKADKITNQMAALKNLIGFNPLEDVSSVCLYNNSFVPDNGVMLLDGTFDIAKINTLLNLNETHETLDYEGATIHKWYEKKHEHEVFGAADPARLIVASHQSKVQAALDTLAGRQKSLAETVVPSIMANCPDGAFFIVAANGISQIQMPPKAAMLSNVEDLGIVIGEKDNILTFHGELTMTSPETAQQITQVIQGLLAFGQINAEKQPYLAQLASAVTVSCEGVLVDINLSYPVDDLMTLLKAMKQAHHP